jgi:hypothetical protein
MDERQITRLNWFLNFINLKIHNLGEYESHDWISEALYMVDYGFPTHQPIVHLRPAETSSYWKRAQWDEENMLEKCQTVLRDFFEQLTERIEKSIIEREDWKPSGEIDVANLFAVFEQHVKFIIQAPLFGGFEGKIVKDKKGREQRFWRVSRAKLYEKKLNVSVFTEFDKITLLLTFIRSLEGVKIGSLRRCPECGNWFLHMTKIKKIYCDNKCASRKNSRERRRKLKETKPKKYKKMMAENAKRARKSYEKKQRLKTPNAKIARRPKIHKD